MSYTYLLAGGGESSAENFLDIEPFVRSKMISTAKKSYCKGNATESCLGSQSGIESKLLTESLGAESLTSFAPGSHAKTSASAEKDLGSQGRAQDSGDMPPESFAMLNPNMSGWKTRQRYLFEALEASCLRWPKWGMMRDGACWELATPEGCTNAIESGLLVLGTVVANEFRGSVRNRFVGSPFFRGSKASEYLRTSINDPQYLAPDFAEEMMGWPISWTALEPLAMDKFRAWMRSHGEPSLDKTAI